MVASVVGRLVPGASRSWYSPIGYWSRAQSMAESARGTSARSFASVYAKLGDLFFGVLSTEGKGEHVHPLGSFRAANEDQEIRTEAHSALDRWLEDHIDSSLWVSEPIQQQDNCLLAELAGDALSDSELLRDRGKRDSLGVDLGSASKSAATTSPWSAESWRRTVTMSPSQIAASIMLSPTT